MLAAQFQHRAIAPGDLAEIAVRLAGHAHRRHGDPQPADRRDQLHVAAKLLEAGLLLGGRVVNPSGEADRAFDREPAIGDPLLHVRKRAAGGGVLADLADPRLDALVSRPGGHVDLVGQRQVLPADRARVETVAKRLGGRSDRSAARRCRTRRQRSSCGKPVAARHAPARAIISRRESGVFMCGISLGRSVHQAGLITEDRTYTEAIF